MHMSMSMCSVCTLTHRMCTACEAFICTAHTASKLQVALPGWAPAPHWRVLAAAVTRAVPGDAYWIDNLQLDSASLLSSAEIVSPVSLEVSLNGQDYSAIGFRYSYQSPPQVSALLPPGGPLGGGTRVRVAGSGLYGGSGYACRFGEVRVHASWDEVAGEVVCVAPPQPGHAPAGGSLPFAVALNVADANHPSPLMAADYTLAAPDFTYHGPLTSWPALPTPLIPLLHSSAIHLVTATAAAAAAAPAPAPAAPAAAAADPAGPLPRCDVPAAAATPAFTAPARTAATRGPTPAATRGPAAAAALAS